MSKRKQACRSNHSEGVGRVRQGRGEVELASSLLLSDNKLEKLALTKNASLTKAFKGAVLHIHRVSTISGGKLQQGLEHNIGDGVFAKLSDDIVPYGISVPKVGRCTRPKQRTTIAV